MLSLMQSNVPKQILGDILQLSLLFLGEIFTKFLRNLKEFSKISNFTRFFMTFSVLAFPSAQISSLNLPIKKRNYLLFSPKKKHQIEFNSNIFSKSFTNLYHGLKAHWRLFGAFRSATMEQGWGSVICEPHLRHFWFNASLQRPPIFCCFELNWVMRLVASDPEKFMIYVPQMFATKPCTNPTLQSNWTLESFQLF